MRSRFGAAAAATVIASIVGGIVAGATVGNGADSVVIHFGVGTGFLLLAVAMFDFHINRSITLIGATAAAIFGGTFVLQGIADFVGNEALSYVAFDVLGHALERILPDVVLAWFATLLVTGTHGRSRWLGWLIVPAAIGLELANLIAPFFGREVPFLKLHLFLPLIWVLVESVKGVRNDGEARVARAAMTVATLAIAAMLAAGCIPAGVKGEGEAVVESREVGTFTRIDADYGIDVHIATGATPSVAIKAQPNIQSIVTTKVDGGTLRITSTKELDALVSIEALVVMPKLDGLALSLGASADMEGIAATSLDIAIESGAEVRFTGTADTVTLRAEGGAQAHLGGLTIGNLDVEVSGGAFAEATVQGVARGDASGGGHFRALGPGEIDVDASGGGEVTRG